MLQDRQVFWQALLVMSAMAFRLELLKWYGVLLVLVLMSKSRETVDRRSLLDRHTACNYVIFLESHGPSYFSRLLASS